MIRQALVLVVMATVLGAGVNLFSPKRIPFVGNYRSLSSGNGPIVPPDAEAGDPAFIAIDVAEMEHSHSDIIFIDTREPAEFACGTIPRSVNIPFEHLPEDNLELYIDSILGGADKEHPLITFCSGEECDLSLHLARILQSFGYENVAIFFGGSREWEKFGLEVERRVNCDE
jgi:rhodanese-related sulfurtransferase